MLELTETTLERVGAAADVQEEVMRAALRVLAEADWAVAPPHLAAALFEVICAALDDPDPFADLKRATNERVLALAPALRERIRASADPFRTAVKLALAGNIVDFGIPRAFDLAATVDDVLGREPDVDDIEALRAALGRAERVLLLADNAGELVLDRLLLEQLEQPERVTVVVRGGPALNDVTLDDAAQVGLDGWVPVMDSGVALAGSCLARSRPALGEAFAQADVIIAKGQGNFETLHELAGYPLFFLFMVKCSVVAAHLGLPQGSSLAAAQRSLAKPDR